MGKWLGRWAAFAMVLTLVGCGSAAGLGSGLPVSGPGAESDAPGGGGPSAGGNESEARAEWEGLYPAYQMMPGGKRWGYVDRTGSFVIAPQFASAERFQPDGLASISQGDRSGLINTKGELVHSGTGIYLSRTTGGAIFLDGDSGSRLLDTSGSVLFEADWFAGDFSDGLALFHKDGRYGYVDSTGRVVIEPTFASADPFVGGLALVQLPDGPFAIINSAGEQVRQLGYENAAYLSDGMYAYQDPTTRLWGYKPVAEDAVIPPQFLVAGAFADGLAIVQVGDDWFSALYGVIDRQGNFVIPAEYGFIEYLGEGLFAVAGEVDGFGQSYFLTHAIFSADGRQLTDFRFYDAAVTPYGISVSDGSETYFLNRQGERDWGLPSAEGRGRMYALNDLIAVEVDGGLRYVTPEGEVIWEPATSMLLDGGGEIREQKHREGPFVLIRYPQVAGLADARVQGEINQQLYEAFVSKSIIVAEDDFDWDVDVEYTAEQIGRVLVVRLDGYFYPAGAAHGTPVKEYFHFDLDTGAEYGLADLFKPGSAYPERLRELVSEQTPLEPEVKPEHPFTVTEEGLVVYWTPYEIDSYAAGFPTFLIPWANVQDLIDTEGPFWRALGR